MGRRLDLDEIFKTMAPHVYFQPPEDIKMQYPCIVYRKEPGSTRHADNEPYNFKQQYEVTLIALDPDSDIFDKLRQLPESRHSANFVAEGLHHSVFAIFF